MAVGDAASGTPVAEGDGAGVEAVGGADVGDGGRPVAIGVVAGGEVRDGEGVTGVSVGVAPGIGRLVGLSVGDGAGEAGVDAGGEVGAPVGTGDGVRVGTVWRCGFCSGVAQTPRPSEAKATAQPISRASASLPLVRECRLSILVGAQLLTDGRFYQKASP